MSLADTIAKVRSGVFQIAFANANDEKIGGGSGFLANDFLITNNHVYAGHLEAHRVWLRRDDMPPNEFCVFSREDFTERLVTGSQTYDYAVLKVPEICQNADHRFSWKSLPLAGLAMLLRCLVSHWSTTISHVIRVLSHRSINPTW